MLADALTLNCAQRPVHGRHLSYSTIRVALISTSTNHSVRAMACRHCTQQASMHIWHCCYDSDAMLIIGPDESSLLGPTGARAWMIGSEPSTPQWKVLEPDNSARSSHHLQPSPSCILT